MTGHDEGHVRRPAGGGGSAARVEWGAGAGRGGGGCRRQRELSPCERPWSPGRQRHKCKVEGCGSICAHGRERYYCTLCGGAGMCDHGKRRDRCKEGCGGPVRPPEGQVQVQGLQGLAPRGALSGAPQRPTRSTRIEGPMIYECQRYVEWVEASLEPGRAQSDHNHEAHHTSQSLSRLIFIYIITGQKYWIHTTHVCVCAQRTMALLKFTAALAHASARALSAPPPALAAFSALRSFSSAAGSEAGTAASGQYTVSELAVERAATTSRTHALAMVHYVKGHTKKLNPIARQVSRLSPMREARPQSLTVFPLRSRARASRRRWCRWRCRPPAGRPTSAAPSTRP
jgi:hypothetical protein